jgi:hypothetical protein
MFGIVLVGVGWDGKRTHVDDVDEFGGFLDSQEGVAWATDRIVRHTAWNRYRAIEVHDFKLGQGKTLVATLDSETLVPGVDMSHLRPQPAEATP